LFGGLKYSPYICNEFKKAIKMKVLGISIIETNDLWLFLYCSTISETNLIEIERLKKFSH
jgi:hypothetical protein